MLLSFDAWTPDLPSLAGGNDKSYNVIPAKASYRPVSDLTVYTSNGLNARCQGAAAYLDNSGNVNAFAGEATKLWRLTAGSTAFADVSGAAYTTAADGQWNFTAYGNQIIATNFNDDPQLFTVGVSSAFAALASGTAPKARYCTIAKNFLFFANTNDGSDGNVPYRLWWSKQGDVTSFPTPGSSPAIAALSDKRDLAGSTGWIQGLASGLAGADLGILTERGLFRGNFTPGSDQIWSFDLVEGARGTPAPSSLVQTGGDLYYLGEDGFYAFNGVQAMPIGASQIDKFFFSDTSHGVDQNHLFRVSAIADPINKVVMWAYPSVFSQSGSLDRVICFNWEVGRWSLITGLASIETMMQLRSLGYSLDSLDTLSPSIDDLVLSLDSRQLTGGRLLIGAFEEDHKLYTFSGSNLAATITATEQGHPTGQRMAITEAWPIIEGSSVTPTITPLTRNRQEDAATTGTAVAMNATGFCPLRIDARYVSAQIDIPAGSTWLHAIGVQIPDEKIVTKGYR